MVLGREGQHQFLQLLIVVWVEKVELLNQLLVDVDCLLKHQAENGVVGKEVLVPRYD